VGSGHAEIFLEIRPTQAFPSLFQVISLAVTGKSVMLLFSLPLLEGVV
jgi:hypothetical protein